MFRRVIPHGNMIFITRTALKLCRRQSVKSDRNYCSNLKFNTSKHKDFETLYNENKDKIIFSSYIDHEKVDLGYLKFHLKRLNESRKEQKRQYEERFLPALPVSLQYFVDKNELLQEETVTEDLQSDSKFQLPYAKSSHIIKTSEDNVISQNGSPHDNKTIDDTNIIAKTKWMTNYDHFDDSQCSSEESDDDVDVGWSKQYGTPNPEAEITTVPCGGCGTLLHCNDPAIPGYLPSEIIMGRSNEELKTMECQRCHFLKEYNIALDVNVQPEEYEKLLQCISYVKSLVVLMVDLLDFPCSIWPGIVDIIGTQRPIIIVGNKVDLLPGDSIGYLKRIRESLLTEINKTKLRDANIKHVSLVSAKTGFGVEDLISAMFRIWHGKGDVFLVGCTNVGKSSLFNALLQSDYCNVQAADIVKRATVSPWPGTTLNLLKFPITRPSGWKISTRTKRLQSEAHLLKVEKDIRNEQLSGKNYKIPPALIGHIGRSFSNPSVNEAFHDNDQLIMVLDEKDKTYTKSKWFYDTPGVVHPDQVLSLLTTEELLLTLPKNVIRPQTYYIDKGRTIFIGGLARIDNVDCGAPCRFTIFCSESLPITVTKIEHANEVYAKFVGTEMFAVPIGSTERMSNWSGLAKCNEDFVFSGAGPKWCCGDVVLSSVAWVSVTAKCDTICKVAAWSPGGKGIYKRYPSVLPYSINLKGKRVPDTPAYMVGKIFDDIDKK